MDYHKNARTTVWSREEMAKRVLERGLTLFPERWLGTNVSLTVRMSCQVEAMEQYHLNLCLPELHWVSCWP